MSDLESNLKRLRVKNYKSLESLKDQENVNELILNALFMVLDEIEDLKKEVKEVKGKKTLKSRVIDLENKVKSLEKKK